ncbi:MAG TPA: hypothetical protein VHS52_07180 [Acidimicrobiales bacterium]|jgi:hypothetical protein|nr:hypothetical protein [Acidimicrobiales bacterium]
MDVPPYADAGAAAAGAAAAGPSPGPSPVDAATAELARRLDAVEAGLGRLGGRVEALAVSLEASFETAVATEVQAAAAELRHTVSELGRILVRDLGKLPQMLSQHRQAIVAELRASRGPEVAPAPAPGPVPEAGDEATPGPGAWPVVASGDDHDAGVVEVDEAFDADPDTGLDSDAEAGPGGAEGDRKRRGHLRRHRQA